MVRQTSWGIASFVLAILSILFIGLPYLGLPLAILAVVFYGLQKKEGKTNLASAGLIIGIVGIVLNAIMLIVIIGALSLAGFVLGSARGVEINVDEDTPGELTIDATLPGLEDTIEVHKILITINTPSEEKSKG